MNTKTQHFTILFIIVAALLALTAGLSLAKDRPARFLETWQVSDSVGTGFTYQGQLTDGGTPAEGIFDL